MNTNSAAWTYFIHADNLMTGRVNFFLVAEAMLVAAFVTLPAIESYLRILICVLALVYTASWFYVNVRLAKRMAVLIPKMKEDPLFQAFLDAGRGPSARSVLCYVLPLSTLVFWILLLYKSF